MPRRKSIYYTGRLLVLSLALWSWGLPRPASAQCSRDAALGFQNVSPEPGNPFQAEYSVNITSQLRSAEPPPGPVLRFVMRDSRGRVRVEHSRGKYDVQTADGTQASEDRVSVFICDPASGTSVHLDSLNKIANVHAEPERPEARTAGAGAAQPFCARMYEFRTRNHDTQTKDLGHQQIAGMDARGLRFLSTLGARFDLTPSFTYTDTWCSEDLAAIVSVVVVSASGEYRRETVLQKVSRKEPDPALFQIPAGYTRVQRENSPGGPGARIAQAPSQ
jgi:hypothetical protein